MNISLGNAGEELVVEFEKAYLRARNLHKLAESVERISLYDDSAGFDILSKNERGIDKYIEVKTTKLRKETPIYFSYNEYSTSVDKKDNYNLYRVFDFSAKPSLFILKGCFDDFCYKETIKYKGSF